MKKLLLFLFFCIAFLPVFAKHVVGGEIIYDYLGPGDQPNTKIYRITVRLFRDAKNCTLADQCAELPGYVRIGIFNNDNGQEISGYININLSSLIDPLPVIYRPPCLTNDPELHYQAGFYTTTVTLSNNNTGYTISYQTCCRVSLIDNIGLSTTNVGVTYTSNIPGTQTLPTGFDSSPRFETGISLICYKKPFTLDFSAVDPDSGDSLVYSMASAYKAGSNFVGSDPTQNPAAPPYSSVPYVAPYSGINPFGTFAIINSATGIISGTAPEAGKYIICVIVKSYRNGRYISEHRKDFIILVAECDFAKADLNPGIFTSCDGFTKSFKNTTANELNLTFDWDFGDPASGAANTSTDEIATHTYTAPGDYTLTLIVNRNTPCADTAHAIVKVYPGFSPAFAPIPPMCKDLPVQFTDATTATFGTPNYWSWNFGDPQTSADTSHLQNPTYTYHIPGTYNAQFIVETTKGCRDTLYPEVTIVDKPDFHLPDDTLICIVDTLQLHAATSATGGTITWSPNYMIDDIHSFTPLVSPDITTTYTALFVDQFGCNATEKIKINVVNAVSLTAANDTTVCRTDSLTLNIPNTNALYFQWTSTPAAIITNPGIRNPVAVPSAPETNFHIKASISDKCYSEDDIVVKTVPYPLPFAGGDDPICFGKDSRLRASGGSSYTWSPVTYLSNPHIPNPVSQKPKATVFYTVTITDTLGCPKPVTANFTVHVIKIVPDAGPQDTSIVLGQPLQLHATGSTDYEWVPDRWLSDSHIADPVANPLNNITYTVKVSNGNGCFAEDTINVKVYFVPPDVYVPSAFTPGNDALNDLFRPVALGIKTLEYFRVFNRWGELVYSTNRIYDGWNGSYKGKPQPAGTFVWEIDATDYKNKKIRRKGSVILIR